MIIFGILGLFLIGIPLGLWAFDAYVIPIDRLINSFTQRMGLAGLISGTASVQV